MGPFVPDIISDELNLVFGFLIGIAFGFVLEQAGFSSSRKLSGLFYGRDFTVLRVFFTAAITAMIGILLLSHFGLLDPDIIYINPTYLWAAIIGGVIMGFGFIIGGYCPGTSVCGAAIGKIDAMIFIAGSVIGVFIFGEMYPTFEHTYMGSYLGDLTLQDALGIRPGIIVLAVLLIAVVAFIVTTRIERRVNPGSDAATFKFGNHRLAAIALVVVGIVVAFLPDRKQAVLAEATIPATLEALRVDSISAGELAFRLIDRDPSIAIVDVRDAAAFAKLALPGAINIPLDQMFGKRWADVLNGRKVKVFVAADELQARTAEAVARALGYNECRYLVGGLTAFQEEILSTPAGAPPTGDAAALDAYRFHKRASVELAAMIKEQAQGPRKPVNAIKKVSGGCGS
jgi:rhodanese-related sulfurtransferase